MPFLCILSCGSSHIRGRERQQNGGNQPLKGCSEVERSSRTQKILGVGMKIRVGSEETGARRNVLRGIASGIYSKRDMGLDGRAADLRAAGLTTSIFTLTDNVNSIPPNRL